MIIAVIVVILIVALSVYAWYEFKKAPSESDKEKIDPDYFP